MRWPPLIDAGHLPWWVVARDTVATLFAWAVLLYVIRDLPWMAAYYALRVLVYLGTHSGRLVTTQEISSSYGISRNHLVRVIQTLAACE